MQMGTLYASNDASSFSGTGGPYGFSPWTFQFGGVVSSAGLWGEPFDDVVYTVAAQDELIFVIAVQNLASDPAYDVWLQGAMPAGFTAPPEGTNLTVTDGTGNDLAFTGDLAAGLHVTPAVGAYDPDSGGNIVLVTYALQATAALPGPYVTIPASASLIHVAAAPGGDNLVAYTPAAAGTTVVSASVNPAVVAETDPGAVARGQLIAFDVTVPLPSGTLRDLRLDTVLPAGPAFLSLVSATVVSEGSRLTAPAPVVSGGTVQFGTVTSAGETDTGNASAVVRLVVRANGAVSGPAELDAVVSGLDASGTGTRWTATVASTVGVVVPPVGSTVGGVTPSQGTTTTGVIRPFADLVITDAAPGEAATLAITLQDGALGALATTGPGSIYTNGATFLLTGTPAALQAAARQLTFDAAQAGTARFNVTVVNSAGGVVQNSDTAVAIAASADPGGTARHYASAPGSLFLVQQGGYSTVAVGEAYGGSLGYIQNQFIHDGTAPATITAEGANVYVKTFASGDTVILQSGRNVVDAGTGAATLVSGSGTDAFFLDARGGNGAASTLGNFHTGDLVTMFGFKPGTSRYSWTDTAAGTGGRTLQFDLGGTGRIDASVTFAGVDKATADHFLVSTGQGGGTPYLTVLAR